MAWTTSGDEIKKTLTGYLVQRASGVVGLDNIPAKFDSAVWAKILTDLYWTERLLGGNVIVGVKIRTTWFGTGNNVTLSNEMVRRVLHIRIEPNAENPEDVKFTKDPLEAWVLQERPRLVHAALTLARHAFVLRESGELPTVAPWGSYEAYNNLIGGLMAAIEMPDWRANVAALRENQDDDLAPWRVLLPRWADHLKGEQTASEVFSFARQIDEALAAPLLDEDRSLRARTTTFGIALHAIVGRVIGGYVVQKPRTSNRGRMYTIRKAR